MFENVSSSSIHLMADSIHSFSLFSFKLEYPVYYRWNKTWGVTHSVKRRPTESPDLYDFVW
jgi:hypothetical protein